MSSSDIAVQARDISKSYRIQHEARATTLGESIASKLRKPLSKNTVETFFALKDVDFDIKKGDVVGIIGRNGAGKSTLLKVLSRITAPSTGEITIRGRVGSLLEVGTGFHPELTGRENVYLNGAILGMNRREIESRFDEIVEFSGVERFLDTPVKRFSSGMYVRLAFAVAAHLEPEVMIVDEVLAVGDTEFQKKCLGKMKDVADQGRTILFVSHNMQTISQLCKNCFFLKSGKLEFVGPTDDAVNLYVESQKQGVEDTNPDLRKGTGECRIGAVSVERTVVQSGDPIRARFTVERKREGTPFLHTAFFLHDEVNTMVIHGDSRLQNFGFRANDRQVIDLEFGGVNLKPGTYRLDLMVHYNDIMDMYEGAANIDVSPVLPERLATSDFGYQYGQVIAETKWAEVPDGQ